MKCIDCPYYYAKNDEKETCHYPWDDGYAPCEVDEPEETEDIDEEEFDYEDEPEEDWNDADDDCGFDPYLGCYTDDC